MRPMEAAEMLHAAGFRPQAGSDRMVTANGSVWTVAKAIEAVMALRVVEALKSIERRVSCTKCNGSGVTTRFEIDDVIGRLVSTINCPACGGMGYHDTSLPPADPPAPEPERRARVQGNTLRGQPKRPPGTVTWAEHETAYAVYSQRYGTQQSAERIVDRGGFSYEELTDLLGHDPTTWTPNQ